MVRQRSLADDYVATIAGGIDEVRFLGSIPWVIDAEVQELNPLLRALNFEATRLAELEDPPEFSLVAALGETDPHLLDQMILSVRCQSWRRWELLLVAAGDPSQRGELLARRWAERDQRIKLVTCDRGADLAHRRELAIARAAGGFIALIEPDAVLHPAALGTFARRLVGDRDANLIFSNEAVLDEVSGRLGGFFTKPDFDPFTLLRIDSVGHLTAIRQDLLQAARRDDRVCRSGYDGVEDHELALRLAATGVVRSIHLPLFLCYRRASPLVAATDPAVIERRLRLVAAMTSEFYPGARFEVVHSRADSPGSTWSVKLRTVAGQPRASLLIVVPFQDHVDQTLRCVESIEGQEHDLDVTVILVDNRSGDAETGRQLRDWLDQPHRCCYRLVEHAGAFNYARINNEIVRRFGATTDLVLFLNNDVELVSPDGLQTMAMQLRADERCGVVGIRLMYPHGGGVQHGGLKVTHHLIGSGYYVIGHACDDREFVRDERITLGVTFACAMIRRSLFDLLGGLEEVMMPNAFGDVDFCARAVEAGFRNYYFGTLVGIHGESKTRGRAVEDVEFTALHERHAATFAAWRLRSLAYSAGYTWPLIAVSPAALIPGPAPAPPPVPLRYLVVDRANAALKVALGPMHRAMRTGLIRSWQILRRVRSRPNEPVATDPAIRRPFLLRRDRSRPIR